MTKFQKGESGNPNGRPQGTGHRQQMFNALIMPHKEALFEKAIELAMHGNEAMLRLLLERLLPAKPKDEPINIKFPGSTLNEESLLHASEAILRGVESQDYTPEEARSLLDMLRNYRDNILCFNLKKRLDELQENIKKSSLGIGKRNH